MIKAIIFDFDGLILDTESPVFQSWQELYQACGFRLSYEKWVTVIGRTKGQVEFDPLAELEDRLRRPLARHEASRRLQRERELILGQSVLPGVRDYLRGAKGLGMKVGLASSSHCDWVTGHLSRLGLIEDFECIMAADDVVQAKPDPTVYLRALECLGVEADQAVALEDSPNGALAAKRAGLFCIVVPNQMTLQLTNPHADLMLESLAELPLEALLARVEQELKARRVPR